MRTLLRLLSGISGILAFLAIGLGIFEGTWRPAIILAALWVVFAFLAALVPGSQSSRLRMAVMSEEFGGSSTAEVQRLVGKGANVNALGPNGRPIHEASLWGRVDVVEELLRNGADPNGRNPEGWTALHIAANNDNAELIDLLIANGADVAARSKHGETALDIAVIRLVPNAAECLLRHGANPNATNGEGRTALQEVAHKMEVFSGPPMVLDGRAVRNDDAIQECIEFAGLLRRYGAV